MDKLFHLVFLQGFNFSSEVRYPNSKQRKNKTKNKQRKKNKQTKTKKKKSKVTGRQSVGIFQGVMDLFYRDTDCLKDR